MSTKSVNSVWVQKSIIDLCISCEAESYFHVESEDIDYPYHKSDKYFCNDCLPSFVRDFIMNMLGLEIV